ncbi:PI-PLC X domain-containing protein 1 [Chanos chanos]|uniref:PI-PLC X domain-containing protein 1 n=1 Tax=Chanos chanos TaxID=29144 RepID=A0A6J2WQ68_CHACN|nr:PI-PLC X domain-containing protein 1-like [Chanos chanos]
MDYTEEQTNLENWMSTLPVQLWDVPLTNLAIPGSHDAMSYCLDINSPLVRSESDTFRLLDSVFYCFTRPAIFRWATTQQKGILDQLAAGIRYFDLRIARKQHDTSDDLYFTHVIYTYVTVAETLQAVVTWLEAHPNEVVILACSHFEGLDDGLHEKFIYTLKKIFGSKLCPRNEVLTLRRLWASGYQVILSYDGQTASRHKELWPAIPYWWANSDSASGLLEYLEWKKELGRPDGFFVTGLNLTADRRFITTHPRESLHSLTVKNWERVRRWLQNQTAGSDANCLNIIAGDFIGPLPLCPTVISLNKKLHITTGH